MVESDNDSIRYCSSHGILLPGPQTPLNYNYKLAQICIESPTVMNDSASQAEKANIKYKVNITVEFLT